MGGVRALSLLMFALFLLESPLARADMPPPVGREGRNAMNTALPQKPVAIFHVNDGSPSAAEQAEMVRSMSREAGGNFSLTIRHRSLDNLDALPDAVERSVEKGAGLVLIVGVRDMDAIKNIPGLYPDVNFTLIGVDKPHPAPNVRTIQFREAEGAFMMGVLAAMQSRNASIAFISSRDDYATRNLAYAYLQGARYVNSDIKVMKALGVQSYEEKPGRNLPDILFVPDERLLEAVLRGAKARNQLVIAHSRTLADTYPGTLLTRLLKHYDLAIYRTLRNYSHNEWKPGNQTMGIGNSYIDYVLDNNNRPLIPKEMIEQIETVKDLVSQGVIDIATLEE